MSRFLLGGRLGDLVHSLYIPYAIGGKHDLYITDDRRLHSDGFLKPLRETFMELVPIITEQDWFHTWNIYGSHESPPFEVSEQTNLSMWRRYAYSASWTQLLSNTFNVPIKKGAWIRTTKKEGWHDKVVIHCSSNPHRRGEHWNIIFDKYGDQAVFVGNEEEFKAFGYKIPFYEPSCLYEHFRIINSCKFFIGNQSAPLAMAHSLDIPRLAILNDVDKIHYKGEERFSDNFYWLAPTENYFPGLNF